MKFLQSRLAARKDIGMSCRDSLPGAVRAGADSDRRDRQRLSHFPLPGRRGQPQPATAQPAGQGIALEHSRRLERLALGLAAELITDCGVRPRCTKAIGRNRTVSASHEPPSSQTICRGRIRVTTCASLLSQLIGSRNKPGSAVWLARATSGVVRDVGQRDRQRRAAPGRPCPMSRRPASHRPAAIEQRRARVVRSARDLRRRDSHRRSLAEPSCS
jgi:hypothetical protein